MIGLTLSLFHFMNCVEILTDISVLGGPVKAAGYREASHAQEDPR